MDAWVCRRVLTGHKDDVQSIAGPAWPKAATPKSPLAPRPEVGAHQSLLSMQLIAAKSVLTACYSRCASHRACSNDVHDTGTRDCT